MQNDKEKLKKEFLENEIAASSIFAAFGHANVYKKGIDERNKGEFRKFMYNILKTFAEEYKHGKVDGERHARIIEKIKKDAAEHYGGILQDNNFRIGVSQKLFNLYLKYLWVLGWIKTPPHCPFDRGIIFEISSEFQKGESICLSWIQCDHISCYKSWVDAAKKKAGGSIAEWELKIWNETKKSIRKGQIF